MASPGATRGHCELSLAVRGASMSFLLDESLNLLAIKAAKDLDNGGTKGIDYFSLGAADTAAFDFSLSARC